MPLPFLQRIENDTTSADNMHEKLEHANSLKVEMLGCYQKLSLAAIDINTVQYLIIFLVIVAHSPVLISSSTFPALVVA